MVKKRSTTMLTGTFSKLRKFRALVIGDFMLDIYTKGVINRISPEAPVSVLHVKNKEVRAGGAGNVALGLRALGAEVAVIGRVGNDASGYLVQKALQDEGIVTTHLLQEKNYLTPIKDRLIAGQQQILRVDEEQDFPVSTDLEKKVLFFLESMISSISIIAISDYNKGFLSEKLLRQFMKKAAEKNIPVICDPKGVDFAKYSGAYLIKPNLKEAFIASGLQSSEDLHLAAKNIFKKADVSYLLVTKSEKGMSLFPKKAPAVDFPVKSREVMDVTGAGDTVLATLSAAIASGLDVHQSVDLANAAAGIAIERLGCAAINLSDLARRLLEMDTENKVFDETHLYALKKALDNRVFSILVIDTTLGITPGLFQTIRRITKKDGHELLLYIRDEEPDEDFIHILSCLNEVSFIILRKDSLQNLCEAISPQNIHFVQPKEEEKSWLSALSVST